MLVIWKLNLRIPGTSKTFLKIALTQTNKNKLPFTLPEATTSLPFSSVTFSLAMFLVKSNLRTAASSRALRRESASAAIRFEALPGFADIMNVLS